MYLSVVEMAGSQSLVARIAAAVAAEGEVNPMGWAQANVWAVVSEPGWSEAWDYAKETYTDDFNPDTGKRPGVINDQMILSAVQSLLSAEAA